MIPTPEDEKAIALEALAPHWTPECDESVKDRAVRYWTETRDISREQLCILMALQTRMTEEMCKMVSAYEKKLKESSEVKIHKATGIPRSFFGHN